MRNNKYIRCFTALGLLAILALQGIWLYNTYVLISNDIYKECSVVLDKALYEEINLISSNIPEGTAIRYGEQNDTIPENTYFYEGLWKLGITFSIAEIDSIAGVYLKDANIDSDYLICTLNPKTKEIYAKSKMLAIPKWGTVESEIIPVRIDLSQGIQLVLKNPYYTILRRMVLLMIATAIMMLFVIGCIVYQIKIVARLKKIFQVREDFSYAMIHDMKTPLCTIMIGLNFLRSGKLDDKPVMKDKYYTIVESEADHLLTLTNKVLTISKLENHKIELSKKVVQLEPMMEKLSEKFIAKSTKPVHFTMNLEVKEVYADEEFFEEAISNLIDNSIKYSKESVEITISSSGNSVNTIVKVHDNGLGISEEDQRTIFYKYERAAATGRSRNGGATGLGLGLNYVYQVIEAHEGKVFVNSIEGEFSEFIIYLPRIID